MSTRSAQLKAWLAEYFQAAAFTFKAIANDASTRSFYRVLTEQQSFVAIDAPPQQEDAHAFVAIDKLLLEHHLPAPKIFAVDYQQGFLLVSDLGSEQLYQVINNDNADAYYKSAIALIIKIQNIKPATIPHFDAEFIADELSLFKIWFLEQYLQHPLINEDIEAIDKLFVVLINNAVEQPQVFMHRDFHSRNLLLNQHNQLGIVDFQSAMLGPISYDLAGLVKDCYLTWPDCEIENWVKYYYDHNESLASAINFAQFLKWFHLMGLQRHIKVLGSFSRSYLRDNKSLYLQEIPRLLNYIETVVNLYEECFCFKKLLQSIKLAVANKVTA